MLSSSHNIAIVILKSQQREIVTKLVPLHSLVQRMGGSGGITLESGSASPSRSACGISCWEGRSLSFNFLFL